MEPGESREPREPGPGAETAAAPHWEEAKTFYDNLAPQKKPKSVRPGHGYGTGQGEDHTRRGQPFGEGPAAPLREGTQVLITSIRQAVGTGSVLF